MDTQSHEYNSETSRENTFKHIELRYHRIKPMIVDTISQLLSMHLTFALFLQITLHHKHQQYAREVHRNPKFKHKNILIV